VGVLESFFSGCAPKEREAKKVIEKRRQDREMGDSREEEQYKRSGKAAA